LLILSLVTIPETTRFGMESVPSSVLVGSYFAAF
jgi:hypothetical protein